MANKASVLGASQGKKILHLKPKKELREPDAKTKKTIERLYEPKEEKVSEVNKLLRKQKTFKYGGTKAFSTQSVRFGPVRSGNTKLLDTRSAQMYNRGYALHTEGMARTNLHINRNIVVKRRDLPSVIARCRIFL